MSHPARATASEPSEAAPPHRSSGAPPGRWWALALLCLGQFMLIADVTVTNVALPTIGADLHLTGGQLTWVVTAYTLCFGSLLLLGGRMGDLLGRQRVLLAGLALFTAASLASGLAPNGEVLVAARAAQGVGAALLSPSAMAVVTTLFRGPERNRALGVWAAVGASGAAVGVLLGGLVVSGPGWRWAFFINLPVGVLVLIAVPLLQRGSQQAEVPARKGDSGFDLPGALALVAAPALLIYGLVKAREDGFAAMSSWLPILLSALAATALLAAERRAADPLLRLELLGRRPLIAGSTVMLVASGLLISSFFLLSFFTQQVLGRSALQTGVLFLPAATATVVGAHLGAHAVGRLGARPVVAAAFLTAAGGGVLLARLDRHSGTWSGVLPGFALVSLGLGAAFVSAATGAMSGLDAHETGLASGIVNTAHELGSALGVATVAAIAGAGFFAGPHAATTTAGFTHAFTAIAAIAATAAVTLPVLVPGGRPDVGEGPVFAH